MARKREELGSTADALIAKLVARGATADVIAKELRARKLGDVSVRTIGRRVRELRGSVRAGRVSKRKTAPSSSKKPKLLRT